MRTRLAAACEEVSSGRSRLALAQQAAARQAQLVTALRVQAQRQQRKLQEQSSKLEEQGGLLGQMQAAARAFEAEARGDTGRYGEIWGDMGRYGEI